MISFQLIKIFQYRVKRKKIKQPLFLMLLVIVRYLQLKQLVTFKLYNFNAIELINF